MTLTVPVRSALFVPPRAWLGAALAAVLALPAAAQSVGAPAVTFPASQDRATLVEWLGKETDVRAETVVAATPESVLSILQSRQSGGSIAVVVRGEVLTPEAFARDKVLSWHATVQVDCAAKRVRQGVTTGYAARNLLFDGQPIRAADADWSTPNPGEPLDQVRRAVCEPGFRPPLTASEAVAVVAATPPPAPPPPVASKAAPRPPAAPPAARKPAVMAKVSAQVAAAGSPAEAARVLERLKAQFSEPMAGLDTRVVKAVVGGKTYHRAIVLGFPDRASAAAFCTALKMANQACFVRGDLG